MKYISIQAVKDIPAKLKGYYNLPFIPKGTIIKNTFLDKASDRKLYKREGDRYYVGFNSCVDASYFKEITNKL
jgi:hypothetical protein